MAPVRIGRMRGSNPTPEPFNTPTRRFVPGISQREMGTFRLLPESFLGPQYDNFDLLCGRNTPECIRCPVVRRREGKGGRRPVEPIHTDFANGGYGA